MCVCGYRYVYLDGHFKKGKKGRREEDRRRRKGRKGRKQKEGRGRQKGRKGEECGRRERRRKRGREKGEEKGRPSLLSIVVINTTTTKSLRKMCLFHFTVHSWREAKARVQTGTRRQEQNRDHRRMLLNHFLSLFSYTNQDRLPRSSTAQGARCLPTSTIH